MSTEPQNPFTSKTLWMSLIVAVAGFFPPIKAFIESNASLVTAVIGFIFGFLRFKTDAPIGLK